MSLIERVVPEAGKLMVAAVSELEHVQHATVAGVPADTLAEHMDRAGRALADASQLCMDAAAEMRS